MALSANTLRSFETETFINEFGVKASSVIYEGSAVGSSGGYARALTAGDTFLGFSIEKITGGSSDGDESVRVRSHGRVQLSVGSLAVTDIGKPVYASDDGTFTLTQSTNSYVGVVHRFVSSGVGIISFDASNVGGTTGITALTDNSGGTANNTIADGFTQGAAFTDNTTGTTTTTLAAGVGVTTLTIPVTLAQITGAGDVLTTITPGYKFKLLAFDAFVTTIVTTGSKAATLNLEIGTTDVTGGTIALTSANSGTLGAKIAGAAITAANTGTSADTISIEAASVTAFSEGEVVVQITIQNMDTADAFAGLVTQANLARTDATTTNDNVADLTGKVNEIINASR